MSDQQTPQHREAQARRELFAVLAHELRSPIGAILGFEELISEGILGDVPPRSADALARIRSSAQQLLELVAGLNDLALEAGETVDQILETFDPAELVRHVIAALRHEALGRETVVHHELPDALPPLRSDAERAARAVQLALMAAIKSTAGGVVRVSALNADDAVTILIAGTRLDPERDDPELASRHPDSGRLSGAGLRISMARRALAVLGGNLQFLTADDGTTVSIRLPRS